MTKKPTTSKDAADKVVKNIRRKTHQTYSSEEKNRIVLAGLRGEESIAVLCRREGIAESLYYSWSKEFLEAGIHQRRARIDPVIERQRRHPDIRAQPHTFDRPEIKPRGKAVLPLQRRDLRNAASGRSGKCQV